MYADTNNHNIEVDPVVIESLNQISGGYSALFWEILYGTSESLNAIKNTVLLLTLLYEEGKYYEAILLIHVHHDLLCMEYPMELELIEKVPELQEPFLDEFLLDADDIIIDYEYEANREPYFD
ncbi:MAG: hypothetical protein LBN22_01745 [Clostridiales Family XIII bacterium]|nr:hypothetical protein [Clostridiales Family XIII bacterium]